MMKKWITSLALISSTLLGAASASADLYWTPWVSEEGGGPWTACTYWNEAAVGFGCSGSYCDNVRMLCETLPGGMTMDPASDRHTPWFSEETGPAPDPNVATTLPYLPANVGDCTYYNLPPGQVCIDGGCPTIPGVISGMHCSGKYCDNLMLECDKVVKYNGATAVPANVTRCHSAGPFSEENGSQDFGANQYITSVTCTGKYCDNKTFTVCDFAAPF